MKLNALVGNMEKGEYDTLREAWIKWNKTCHPEDQIDWIEFYEEATKKKVTWI